MTSYSKENYSGLFTWLFGWETYTNAKYIKKTSKCSDITVTE